MEIGWLVVGGGGRDGMSEKCSRAWVRNVGCHSAREMGNLLEKRNQ
jgi:hypothetical protein